MKIEYYKLRKHLEDTILKYNKDFFKGMYMIKHNSTPDKDDLRFFVTQPAHRIIKMLEEEYGIEVYCEEEGEGRVIKGTQKVETIHRIPLLGEEVVKW